MSKKRINRDEIQTNGWMTEGELQKSNKSGFVKPWFGNVWVNNLLVRILRYFSISWGQYHYTREVEIGETLMTKKVMEEERDAIKKFFREE